MTGYFHANLNRMALFTAVVAAGIIIFFRPFMEIATANVFLNGVIIGTTLFGMGLCFVQMFQLLPEYRWVRDYRNGRHGAMPPRILRPAALMLRANKTIIPVAAVNSVLDSIAIRFEDSRESVRYITNTLIFLGLLGTFWGLIMTVGGFAELIGVIDMDGDSVINALQAGLARPLGGMATAFTSSLMGLGGSLTVGFLALQLQLAQNAMFREMQEIISERTQI